MFHKAIVRRPGHNFADGVTMSALGLPDFQKALRQHEAYCNALMQCGVTVTILDADPGYPDGCFVEDTAVITEKIAIITQPGHPSRFGEQEAIAEVLTSHMVIERISGEGRLDGGDILRAGTHFYIGRSDRTNGEGSRQLASILSGYGYTSSEVPVVSGLHLKSSVSYIGNNTVVINPAFAQYFAAHDIIDTGDEDYAANCLLVNGLLFFPLGFLNTKEKLIAAGHNLVELDMSEFRKMDGGLTCLSLLMYNV